MKYIVYSVRDRLVGFGALLPDTAEANAIRNFAVSMRSNPTARDYDLYSLGEYDTASGGIVPFPVPKLVITGTDASILYASDGGATNAV